VARTLGVDRELREDEVQKTICVETSADGTKYDVVATFESDDLKVLRSATSAYYDLLAVSVRTVERFGK
jgi:hypothetical protein